jgi:hypothetical protein
VECGVWSVECGVWTVDCVVWSVECGVWSVECGLWSVECGLWSVECGVWTVECGAGGGIATECYRRQMNPVRAEQLAIITHSGCRIISESCDAIAACILH